jgi:cytochrome c oxidase subunit 2
VDLAPSRFEPEADAMTASSSTDPSATFELLAPGASSIASQTDMLFTVMLVVCGFVALTLAVLIVWFSIRYREGVRVNRSHPPSRANRLEAAWTVLPLLLFIGAFAWSAHDYAHARRVPADATPVYVVAKQWMWRLQHGNGRQEINELHVPIDKPVVLILASQDVIHSFYVPAFRLKQDVVPGRYTRLWFTASKLGDFRIMCSEYCGSQHSAMLAHVIVMRQADYALWLDSAPPRSIGTSSEPTTAQLGEGLFKRLACASCHAQGSSVNAPALEGLYGREVPLEGGGHVIADDDYLRESIVAPKRRIVRGQAAVMPSYAQQLNEEDVQNLVAYLRTLGGRKEGS